MRMLAVSTAEKWPGTDAPTLMESGYDVNVQNWRMVAAAPGLIDEQKAAVTADIDKLANSAGWKTMLDSQGLGQHLPFRCRVRGATRQGNRGHDRRPEGHRSGAMTGSDPGTGRRPDGAAFIIAALLAGLGTLLIWQGAAHPGQGRLCRHRLGSMHRSLVGRLSVASGADPCLERPAPGRRWPCRASSRCRSCSSSAVWRCNWSCCTRWASPSRRACLFACTAAAFGKRNFALSLPIGICLCAGDLWRLRPASEAEPSRRGP